MIFRTGTVVAGCLTLVLAANTAEADVLITAEEVGGDVVFSGGGSLDISLWDFLTDANFSNQVGPTAIVMGSNNVSIDVFANPAGFAGPVSFLDRDNTAPFDPSGSGDLFGLSLDSDPPLLAVPDGYGSGDPLSSTIIIEGETLSSLGFVEDEYTWSWDTAGGERETFTVVSVPTPGSLASLVVAGLACARRRRRA